jgi:transcriptional regulator with XRE-family HTH domain
MTKLELSRKASVSAETLVSYENGATAPKPRMLGKLVAVLGDGLAPPEATEPPKR